MGIYDRPYYRESSSPDIAPSWENGSAVATLIITCAVVFLANLIFTGRTNAIESALALHASDISHPWMLWRVISYGFTHSSANFFHIVFNMFELWFLGRAVEERYGRSEFFRIYFFALAVCGLGWLILRRSLGEGGSVVGASGAVCCSTMLYVFNYPRATLLLFGVIPIQAWMLGAFLVFSNLFTNGTVISGPGGPSIAFDVHLIGVAVAAAYFYGKWNFSSVGNPMASLRQIRRRLFGPRLKTFQPTEDNSAKEEIEADRLLDKIHRLGQDSLSSKEKRFLEKYSKQVRDRRRNPDA
jgi:membrane associated rhomboid family serine protease